MAHGHGLLGACRDYGFRDVGVFLDWASLYQNDPAHWKEWMADGAKFALSDEDLARSGSDGDDGARLVAERARYQSRTAEERAAFKRALEGTMDLWYPHAAITVVLLTELPPASYLPASFDTSRTYDSRGWTTFERCAQPPSSPRCTRHASLRAPPPTTLLLLNPIPLPPPLTACAGAAPSSPSGTTRPSPSGSS